MASKLNKDLNNLLKVINDIDQNDKINDIGKTIEYANQSINTNNLIFYNHDKDNKENFEQKLESC